MARSSPVMVVQLWLRGYRGSDDKQDRSYRRRSQGELSIEGGGETGRS
ncbi:hypothetical protein TIFTF001_017014 [Ficus carica]|uniref:Uncharacterized protein n=1 Tax=Ficus carica TaxID=3494 RepID=A0AA88A7A6_FICCA|nr:hypothetical protein TIFTF001_017014 [Ficus carica]